MKLRHGRSASRAAEFPFAILALLFTGALALSGCVSDGQPGMMGSMPRGATVAFESIDGPPPGQFQTLVQDLNDEAQARRLAVISREAPSVYRVRGYLAAKTAKGQTTISWVWDVFDRDERRALRITGEETAKAPGRDAWVVADDAMLRRIARDSVAQLAAFLASPDALPAEPQLALTSLPASSPEAAGIFRIFRASADPGEPAAATGAVENADPVPLPRRRPAPNEAVSALPALAFAAAGR
jgi:hypothetical protein